MSKRYSQGAVTALDGIDLTVSSGWIEGVIGFSGAGKSTLLRCLCRLERPDAGSVSINGLDLAALEGAALEQARRKIGVVFQSLHLLRSRTVSGNIALPLEISGTPASEIRDRVGELLKWFGLSDKADAYPSQLSGGQRQRVAIARALSLKPPVLLADEPTSALDPETTASVLQLLRSVRDTFGTTILLITHEMSAVRAICDRVAVLEAGRLVEEGTVDEVWTQPRTAAARRLTQGQA